MSDHRLNADERAILDRALEHEGPSSERIDRIHRDVMTAVAAGAVGAAATAATTQAAAATATKAGALGLSTTTKFWLTNLLIVSGLATTGAVAGIAARPAAEDSVSTAPAVAPPIDELASPTPRTVETPPAAAEDDARENTPKEVARSTPSTARPTSSASLDEEVELLARAQQRLRDGDPQGALRLLNEHDRTFPRGELGPEAEAARVFALCKSGQREEARRAAAAFIARAPGSPLAERVRNACP